ncbi:MAG: hypothetical protein AB7O97_04720 [Planctomycetota bacterium]
MRRAHVFWLVAVLATVGAFAHAWALRWTCDDAYISFRYAQHFAEGHGLVFNLDPDEAPVEGYTNFSWTMLLALGHALGFAGDRLEDWSIAWGALLHAVTALLLAWCSWRSSRGRAWVPIAAPAWAANYSAASLAPAGLETAMFAFLGLGMAALAIEWRCRRHLWLLGFLGVLAAMTRPDGALFVAAAGAVVLWDARRMRAAGNVLAYALPIALCMAPYLLWRHAYYGYWVPNTFYAKSGGDPYPGQGLHYVTEYFKCYAVALVPALLALLALPWRRGDRFAAVEPWSGRRPGLVLCLFVLPYLGFVVWVGGDFMFGRFLIPVTPLLLLALDVLLRSLPRAAVAAMAVATLGTWFRHDPPYLLDYENGISDNRAISVRELGPGLPLTEYARYAGHAMQQLFSGLDVRLGIAGAHANFAYRSQVPVAVECAAGLTDAYIAHLPVPQRSKVGHERNWRMYPGYLERRGVHFMLELHYATGGSADPYRAIAFPVTGLPPMPARIVIYDRVLMRELRRRQPQLVAADFEQVLDDYIPTMAQKGRQQVAKDYAGFREFYFDHNDDPARRAAFEAFLR